MFDNAGGKIQKLAQVTMALGIICSVISGIVAWDQFYSGFLYFVLIAGFGSLGSYISSLFLYAFGEMVENVASIEDDTGHFRKSGINFIAKENEKDKSELLPNATKHLVHCSNCENMTDAKAAVCKFCGTPLR